MRIAITGSNGLLGQKLITLFLEKQIDFLATSAGPNRYLGGNINYASVDISDTKTYGPIEDFKPTHIINTAAMTLVDACETEQEKCTLLNEHSVLYLSQLSNKLNAQLIHLSTDFIFDGTKEIIDENETPNPLSYYGKSKLEGEKILQKNCNNFTIIRTVLVFGYTPGLSRSNVVLWAIDSLKNNKTIHVVTDQYRTPTLAEDLAMACLLIAQKNATGIFNIAGPEYLNIHQLVTKIATILNYNKELIKIADSSNYKPAAKRPPRTCLDISKAKRVLGYKPHTLNEAIILVNKQLNINN